MKSTYPAFSHVDISNQNNFERETMIVGNRLMNEDQYKETTLYRWLFMFAHYLGYLQYISRFLKAHKNIPYKNFYLDLMDFIKKSSENTFLKKEFNATSDSISKVLNATGPWGRSVDEVRKNFAWDFEEATAINIVRKKKFFYSEIKVFLEKYNLDSDLVDELINYQMCSIVDPTNSYPIEMNFNYNFYEVINFSAILKNKSNLYLIEGKNYNDDIFEWGKETLWWGRRVAACKAKVRKIKKHSKVFSDTDISPEIFDKR